MKKVLNSNGLKLIAITAMVFDHVACVFIPVNYFLYYIFRIIGRVSAPIMFFSLANGFKYTRNKYKYGIRLLSFAILSQVPYSLFIGNKLFLLDDYNVLFTLFLGFLCLCCFYNIKNYLLKIMLMLVCLISSCFCDYGLFGMSLMLMFAFCHKKNLKIFLYSLISFVYLFVRTSLTGSYIIFIIFTGLFLAVPLFVLYNGQKGRFNLKYLFYIFYPGHFLILLLINLLIS